MAALRLTLACGDYDRTRALEEGTVAMGSRPLAAPINGAIADHVSVMAASLTTAGVVLAASLLAQAGTDETTPARGRSDG